MSVSVALSPAASRAYERISPGHRMLVDEELRKIAKRPYRLSFRPNVYEGFVTVNDGMTWGYHIQYTIDRAMSKHVPAIAVATIRTVFY